MTRSVYLRAIGKIQPGVEHEYQTSGELTAVLPHNNDRLNGFLYVYIMP